MQALGRLDNCWICGGAIDYAAPAHSPDAWELDHAKSVQHHPELALDPANCRSSHASCNRSRGADGAVMALGKRRKRLRS
ncbi:MAG: HNH endonuclease [Eggerthellaceae bacterium]|nr:HNH endonuclease [Eggerthellaceae bacterium]